MKRVFFVAAGLVIILVLLSASCQKTTSYSSAFRDGIITGFDQRLCPCCGGLMITFTGETKPYAADFYLINNDPSAFGITSSSAFPIAVRVKYTPLEKCNGKYLNITALEKK